MGGTRQMAVASSFPGFSSLSRPSGIGYNREPIDEESEEPIDNLEDLALKQIREYVSLIIMEVL